MRLTIDIPSDLVDDLNKCLRLEVGSEGREGIMLLLRAVYQNRMPAVAVVEARETIERRAKDIV